MTNLGIALALCLAFGGVQIATGVGFKEPLAVAVFIIIAVQFLLIFPVLYHLNKRQVERELASGYTTSTVGFTHLPQIDPYTGLVLRLAGQALMSPEQKSEQRRRVQQFRSASAGNESKSRDSRPPELTN